MSDEKCEKFMKPRLSRIDFAELQRERIHAILGIPKPRGKKDRYKLQQLLKPRKRKVVDGEATKG